MKKIFSDAAKATLGTLFSGASQLISNFKADPTKVVELATGLEELKVNAELKMQELDNALEETYAKEMESVNATMREEAKSEHWAQWLWRPMIGFVFSALLVNNYILMPYFKELKQIEIPDTVFTAILVILGAASAGRGLTKWQKEKK